jgi:hypothetical protein
VEYRLKVEQGIHHDHLSDLSFLIAQVEFLQSRLAALSTPAPTWHLNREASVHFADEILRAAGAAPRREETPMLLKADDLRAWLELSTQTIHVGDYTLSREHARRIATDILELLESNDDPGGAPGSRDGWQPIEIPGRQSLVRDLRRIAKGTRLTSLDTPAIDDAADILERLGKVAAPGSETP